MRVRWVSMRTRKAVYREVDFGSRFDLALVKFIQANNDPYVEAVELLEDKGEISQSRDGFEPESLKQLTKWLNENPEGED